MELTKNQVLILDLLKRLIGPGPETFYRDAIRIANGEIVLESATHVAGHLIREVLSSILQVLAYSLGYEKANDESNKNEQLLVFVVKHLKIDKSDDLIDKWKELGLDKIAHRAALDYRIPDTEFKKAWANAETVLSVLLTEFEKRYSEGREKILELARREEPTKNDLKYLRNNVPNGRVALNAFFQNAKPGWLSHQEFRKSYFKNPPRTLNDFQPEWAESQYLVRSLQHQLSAVVECVKIIPPTDNSNVVNDICSIVCKLPESCLLDVFDYLLKQIKKARTHYHETPTRVTRRYLETAHVNQALELVRTFFEPIRDLQATNSVLKATHATSKMGRDYLYGEELDRTVQEFVEARQSKIVAVLSGLLEDALKITLLESDEGNSYWRSNIDMPDFAEHATVVDHLVTSLYLASLKLLFYGISVDDIMGLIGAGKRHIHDRVINMLLIKSDAVDKDTLEKYLLKQRFDFRYPEYFTALRKHFGALDFVQQQTVFRRIDDLEEHDDIGVEVTRARQACSLRYLEPFLPDERKTQLHSLNELLGDVDLTVRVPSIDGMFWKGPTSPISKQDLLDLPITEIIELLRTWQPSGIFMSPSTDGLGRTIESVVTERASEFAQEAEAFQALNPNYVSAVVNGLREACRLGTIFVWENVINLCTWVVDQPDSMLDRIRSPIDDPDRPWSWTKSEIGRLLEIGLSKNLLSFDLRDSVWKILLALSNDPDPDVETDRRFIEDNGRSPLDRSLNANRGIAFHALFQYALWCARNLGSQLQGERSSFKFSLIPEFRSVVEQNLVNDLSTAVRSVYGIFLPILFYLDEEWTSRNLDRIFPQDNDKVDLFLSAWNTYILRWQFDAKTFSLLRVQYSYAVSVLGVSLSSSPPNLNPMHRLGEHLIMAYLNEVINLNDSVVSKFYSHDNKDLFGHLLRFIGQKQTDLTQNQVIRAKALVEWLLKLALSAPPGRRSEVAKYGWLMELNSHIEPVWVLEQAVKALEFTNVLEPDFYVFPWLASYATISPYMVAMCLQRLLFYMDYWSIHRYLDDIRNTIRTIYSLDDVRAKDILDALINQLLARGDSRLSDLLDKSY